MAKHVTRRSYKKRASKKRRTIRKLKRTMRRKMQRGGNLGVVAPVFILFAALFANNPTVTRVLSVAQTLLGGGDQQIGGNKRLNQMGGGKIDEALDGLRRTINEDTTLTDDRKTELIGCIDTLQSNGGISDADIAQLASNEPQVGGWGLTNAFSEGAAAFSKGAAALQQRAAESNIVKSVSSTAQSMFMDNIRSQFENIKVKIVAKVSNMKDKRKQNCMKSILSYGFDLIKNKISSGISMENITKAMAVEAALAKEKGAELWSKVSDFVKPSSTQATGDDNVHIIEIKKKSGFNNDIDKVSSENNFKLFEDKLRAKLRENGWPQDENEFDVGISSYNTAKIKSDPRLSPMTSRLLSSIFIFALFSGMITSVEFTDDKKETIILSGQDAFFDRYTRGDPYFMFKTNLFEDILPKTSRITKSIQVKITTDFSKIPDYLPVKRAVLKSANRTTVDYYKSVKQQLTASKAAAAAAKTDWERKRVSEAIQLANNTADNAFVRADTAFQAALAAGIPQSELIPIQS